MVGPLIVGYDSPRPVSFAASRGGTRVPRPRVTCPVHIAAASRHPDHVARSLPSPDRSSVAAAEAGPAALEVLSALPDALLVYGRDGRILLTNPAAVVLSGYTRESLQLMPISRLLPTVRSRSPAGGPMRQRDRRWRPTLGEERSATLVRKNGSTLAVAITSSTVEIGARPAVVTAIRPASRSRAESIQQLSVSLSARAREHRAALQERRRYARVISRDLRRAVKAVVAELHAAAAIIDAGPAEAHLRTAEEAADRLLARLDRVGGDRRQG
jgi:PAS domain S-box-containing protein